MWAETEQCTWMQSFAQINTAYNLQSSAFVSQKGPPKNINKHLVTTITRNSRSTDCVLVNFGAHVLPEARRQLHVSISVFRFHRMFGLYVLLCPKWQPWNTHIKNAFSLIWLEAKLISQCLASVWTLNSEDLPLDLNALSSIDVVAFSVCGKVLGVGRGSWLKILGILSQFQPFGFLPWFITEFYESHHHGQPQPSDQNIEDTSHIT